MSSNGLAEPSSELAAIKIERHDEKIITLVTAIHVNQPESVSGFELFCRLIGGIIVLLFIVLRDSILRKSIIR